MVEPNRFNVSPEKNYKYYIKEDLGHRISNVSNSSMHHRNKSFDLILNNQYQNRESLASKPNIGKCVLSGWGSCKSYPLVKNLNVAGQYNDILTTFKNFEEDIISIAPSDSHILILTSTGRVYACGRNEQSQLGGNFGPVNQSPGLLEFPYKAVVIEKISVGSDFNFAMSNKAEVFCWGFNMRGQLGVGHYENITTPTLVQSLTKSSTTSVSRSSRSFMKKGRDLSFDIGQKEQNSESQLGPSERVIQIECGGLHTLALTNRNRVFASGFGDTYALGLDKPETICTFNEITWFAKNLGYTDNIEKIACGVSHSGCIAGGKVYLWGILGLNSQLHFKTPVLVSLPNKGSVMTSTSHVNISKDNMNLRKSQKSMLMSNEPNDLKLGDLLTVVLTKKGEVYTMGDNSFGQLGDSKQNAEFYPNFQKVATLDGVDVMSIAVGNNHVLCFERETRNVYGWGNNSQHQIFPGTKEEMIENPKLISNLKGAQVSRIFAGPHTSFCFAKNTPDFGLNAPETNQQSKSNYEHESVLKTELESVRKTNGGLQTENEKLKGEVLGLSNLIGSLEKEKLGWVTTNATTKRGFFSNAATQTTMADDSGNEMFDVMQHFKKKLKIDRTLKPDFEIDFNELTIEKRIGEGGFGIIYRARWRESTIAVKVLKPDLMREETIKDFQNECYAMESLRHPNICMFMGACTKLPNLAIVLEYCSKETLWKLLQNKEIHLTWEDNRRIAIDIAKGMNYLHTFAVPILHRDLKSQNILMDEGYRPKIADFGWTRKMAEKMTGKIGTYQWMAPEVIKSQKYTEKADVFSFAIILWEIASREPPYRNVGGAQVSLEVVNNDLRPNIPKSTPESFAKLMKKCWDRNCEKRPSFKEIIREIENMKLPKY